MNPLRVILILGDRKAVSNARQASVEMALIRMSREQARRDVEQLLGRRLPQQARRGAL